ncbi:hypothetical protein Tco_1520154 [Tanacetum coccineum]
MNSDITWRTAKRQWSVDINSDLISFWIRPVNLSCDHLVTLLHLELKVNDIWVECFNNFISLPFEICLRKHGFVHLLAVPVHEGCHISNLCKQRVLSWGLIGCGQCRSQLYTTSNLLEEGIVQAGSRVAGLSSSGRGFHQCLLHEELISEAKIFIKVLKRGQGFSGASRFFKNYMIFS